MDYLTIATVLGADCATKTHVKMPSGRIVTDAYPRAYLYQYDTLKVSNINELSKALIALEDRKKSLVLRGKPLVERGPRRYKEKENKPATFEPDDHYWVCIDIDDCEIDKNKGAILSAIHTLPECFHTASCHYQYSASMGIKDTGKVKVHLWFWFDRPVCGFSLRRWLKNYPADTSLYNPVQPHYTATPNFVGFSDPLKKRSGMIHGSECVEVPDHVLNLADHKKLLEREEFQRKKEQEVQIKLSRMARKKTDAQIENAKQRYVQGALKNACQEIESQGQGDRHKKIFTEAANMGSYSLFLDESEAKAMLVQAGLAVLSGEGRDREVYRTVDDGWAEGARNLKTLDHIGVEDMSHYVRVDKTPPPSVEVDHSAHYVTAAVKLGVDADELKAAIEKSGGTLTSSAREAIDLVGDLMLEDMERMNQKGGYCE